jgi:hypothetical protein
MTRRCRDRVSSTTESCNHLGDASDDPSSSHNLLGRQLSSSITFLRSVECHVPTLANVNVRTVRTGGTNVQKLLISSVRPRNTQAHQFRLGFSGKKKSVRRNNGWVCSVLLDEARAGPRDVATAHFSSEALLSYRVCIDWVLITGFFLFGRWDQVGPDAHTNRRLSVTCYDPLPRDVRQRLPTALFRSQRSSPLTPPSSNPSSADADADE